MTITCGCKTGEQRIDEYRTSFGRHGDVVDINIITLCFEQANRQHLSRVVPFVESMGGVESFVALQPYELAPRHAGQHLCDLCLADARLSLNEQGLPHLGGEMNGNRQSALRNVLLANQRRFEFVNG